MTKKSLPELKRMKTEDRVAMIDERIALKLAKIPTEYQRIIWMRQFYGNHSGEAEYKRLCEIHPFALGY